MSQKRVENISAERRKKLNKPVFQQIQNAPPVHVGGGWDPRDVQEGRGDVNVEDGLLADGSRLESRTPDEIGNLDVHVEGEGLALDQAELPQVVAVVRGVDDVRVLQLAQAGQLVVNLTKVENIH